MRKRPTYLLFYKYPYEGWFEYDRTQDTGWLDVQRERMERDHPKAEYKVEKR